MELYKRDYTREAKWDAYQGILSKLTTKQNEIYEVVKQLQPCTSKDISSYLNRDKNYFSGRLTELKNLNLIYATGRRDGCAIFQTKEQFELAL